MTTLQATHLGTIWWDLLRQLYYHGRRVSPRGMAIREHIGVHLVLEDARNNVLAHPVRELNHKFMVAEWLWMWFGRDDVATIARYNKQLAQFSDNGVNFNGAYGVPIKEQWWGIRETLTHDPYSRQAVLQIFRVPKAPTKDVPCTINMQFLIRGGKLHTLVNMRSSDVWLGLPYDVFNFTMLANILAAQLHVRLGGLTMHLGSSHLYERDMDKAKLVLREPEMETIVSPQLQSAPPLWLEDVLCSQMVACDWEKAAAEPWASYAAILTGPRANATRYLEHASRLHEPTDAIRSTRSDDV